MDRRLLAALAVAGTGLLGACTSNPSAKTVALDIVESLPDLTEDQRACMIRVIDSYSKDELQEIGEANVEVAINGEGDGTPEMQEFIDRLSECQPPS